MNGMITNISIATLVNKEDVYARMRASLERQGDGMALQFIPLHADAQGWNASQALNRGLCLAEAEWLVCVHQDVVFPMGWLASFTAAAEAAGPSTAVLGLVGCRNDGSYVGHIADPHGHHRWGSLPSPVVSVDEVLIALRKSSGLSFDEANPQFLFYGADICLQARERRLGALVIDAPLIHLSGGRRDTSYDFSAAWLLGKWGTRCGYVIPTTTMLVGGWRPLHSLRWLWVKLRHRLSLREARSLCDCSSVEE